MPMETYLIYLAAVAVFFATPPDTSQLLIISNSIRHGLRRSLWTVFGDLSANAIQMTGAAFGLAADPSAWWVLVGPIAMTGLFVFISIPMIEKRMLRKRPAYADVVRRYPCLLPFGP